MDQVLGPLCLHGRPERSYCWILALDQPSHDCCNYLGGKPADGESLPLCVTLLFKYFKLKNALITNNMGSVGKLAKS